MALSTAQQTDVLFKKLQGVSDTNTGKQFFEEGILGRQTILPSQVWAQGDKIPNTAPGGVDAAITGVVQRFIAKSLTAVAGVSNAFFHADLVNCIPFNFGDGSYNYALTDSSGTPIPFGQGDWLVDTQAGVLTFFGTVPSNMPPKLSFYKYVGTTGVASDTIPETAQTLTESGTTLNVTGLALSSTFRTYIVEYQITRISTGGGSQDLTEYGRVVFTYRVALAAWQAVPMEQAGDDASLMFNVTTGGQVQYTLANTLTGTAPVSTLKYRARTFTA